jgi:hypothetical protein
MTSVSTRATGPRKSLAQRINPANPLSMTLAQIVAAKEVQASPSSAGVYDHARPPQTGPPPGEIDFFVPDPIVAKEFGVTLMTIYRWDRDAKLAKLGWPTRIKMHNGRNYRSRRELEAFKRTAHNIGIAALKSTPMSTGARGRSLKTTTEPTRGG